MRTYLLSLTAAALVCLMGGACNRAGDEYAAGGADSWGEGRLLLSTEIVSDATTRVALESGRYLWSAGDRIGIFIENGSAPSRNVPAALVERGGKYYFEAARVEAEEGDRIYAYYPYCADAVFAEGSIVIPTVEDQLQSASGTFVSSAMPMVAKPTTVAAAGVPTTLQFVPMGAVAQFKVWSSNPEYCTEKVEKIAVQAGNAVSGSISLPYAADDPAGSGISVEGLTGSAMTLTLSEPAYVGTLSTAAAELYLVFPAMTVNGMILTVTTDKATYELSSSSSEIVFARNEIKSLSLDLGGSFVVRRANAVNVPFTTTLYDFINRDPEEVYIGNPVDMEDGGLPGNQFGIRVDLKADAQVAKYWVYTAAWDQLQAYSDSSTNDELLNLVVAQGVEGTQSATFEAIVRQGGPSKITTATAIAVEYENGNREVFRVYLLGAYRGFSVVYDWKN